MGPRGLTVLSIAGIAGVALGAHGWAQRSTGLVSPLVNAPPSSSAPAAAGSSPAATPSASVTAGPRLSSEPYASYAYQVWPGPLSATASRAMTGWTVTVTRRPGGIIVKAVQNGLLMSAVSHFYPGGAKVYVLESNTGDDGGGNGDYAVADDGLVVTNSQGQVLG